MKFVFYLNWRHNIATEHRWVSSLDENKRTVFVDRTSKDEVTESFLSVNKCFTEQSSREDSQENIRSMKRSLKRSTISFIKENRSDFSLKKILIEMVRCSTWIKSGESQSVVWFYSLNKMENFLLKNLSFVEENFFFINCLNEQSEAEIEKENVHWVTIFKSTTSSILHHFAFRSMSCFNSFINSFPISFPKRSSALSVCVKKSICVFCFEEEKIRLTLFSRNASDRHFAPSAPIWFSQRFNSLSVCVKKSICVFCVDEEKIRLTLFSRNASDRDFAPWAPIGFSVRFNSLSVCVKKSIYVFCIEEEKIGLTLFTRNASQRSFAPSAPILFHPSLSVLSVCVKKSICVFCVEEEKIRLTLFSRNASARSFAPLSPILLSQRFNLVSVCVKKSICVFYVEGEKMDLILLWRFEMWQMRRWVKCCFHWKRINKSAETIIQLMQKKQVKPLLTLLFLLHWREQCGNISFQCAKIESFRLSFTQKKCKICRWRHENDEETLKKFIVFKWTFKERNDLLAKIKLVFEEFVRWRFFIVTVEKRRWVFLSFGREKNHLPVSEENRFD